MEPTAMSGDGREQNTADNAGAQDKRELLKRLLRQENAAKPRAAIGRRPDGPAPLSFGQEGLWFIDKVTGGDDSYRLLLLIGFDGRLDMSALQRSLDELVRRHEVLRSVFPEREGQPTVVVSDASAVAVPVSAAPAHSDAERERALDAIIRAEYAIPFDLARGLLFRARLVAYADDAHCLLVMVHHIAADGWSGGVLYREMCDLYAAFAQGADTPLPDPELQYADFAAWQRATLQGPLLDRQLAYWTQHLQGATPLRLPVDRAASPQSGFAALTEERLLPRPLAAALRELSRQQGATLFVTLLAGFEILLQRYSGQDDILIGTPVLTRNRPELEAMVGLLVNMAALRVDLADNPSFVDCMRRVRQTVLGANDHADVPFEKVVQALQPERSGRRNPLFQVAFAQDMGYHPGLAQQRELAGVSIRPLHRNDILTHLDVELYVRDTGTDVALLWVCAQDLFEPATVTRMLDHYMRILEAVAANPQQHIAQLPLLSADESRRLLHDWSGAPADYAQDSSAHALFETWAARQPQAVALEFGTQALNYAELNARAERLASHLRAHGVVPEQLIGVCLERGIDLIVALLAVWKAGGAYLPLDPKYPPARLQYMVQDAGLALIVSRSDLAAVLGDYAGTWVCVDRDAQAVAGAREEADAASISASRLAYVIYTSGSTGRPKGTLLEHRGLCKVSAEQVHWFGAGPGSRVLQFSSPNFDASLFEITMALTTGATLVLAHQEDLQPGPPLARLLRERRISILTIPPSSLSVLPDVSLPDLRVINVAGEACPAALVARWAPARRFFNLYGPTECTIWSTLYECAADGGAPPIGRPLANTKVYVLDAQRRPVPVGVPGELYIGGVGVARGYLNLEQLSAERFIADPFTPGGGRLYRSGDKVRWRADGTLEFLGRIDQQVKLRGYRVELGEIEALLARQPEVEAAVVLARPGQTGAPGDTRLVAYVVARPECTLNVEAVRAALQAQLPAYMVPATFVTLAELPLTANGKVDHKALPAPLMERAPQAHAVAPGAGLEAGIAAIWKDVLGIDVISVVDNFFDLGGHSLLLVQVHDRLTQLTGRELPIATLFQYPTVRALAAHLDPGGNAALPSPRASAHPAAPSGGFEPIAVIGMAGRFPGARDVDTFWRNLCDGVESLRRFSQQELLEAGCDPALIAHPDYVPVKGYLEDADRFDAQFFGYSPREAELIDPQQRLFLECAWEALEAAGYDADRYAGQIGVYAGSSMNTYQLRLHTPAAPLPLAGGIQGVISNDKDFLPTRVSYKLNLRGPSVNVQTACSTSLVAVHQACRSLLGDECDMALAGGASVNAPLVTGYLYESGSIASPDGHCRAFDAAAQGTVGGNGVGVVVLKRLSRALADGDTLHALIRGSALNNDGSVKVGYTAPSVEGQSQVIASALRQAGVDASTIGYIETHGTGTPLGDPIEIAALKRAFGAAATQRIALGSVKTNVGHLDAAAGVAGLIKTVLTLQHRQLPPSLHFRTPNPQLQLEDTPFYVNARLTDWDAGSTPRRAGVSSFGIGGTNAHVVLEEAPPPVAASAARAQQLLVLSARTPQALDALCAQLAVTLEHRRDLALADVAYTLQVGRKRFRHARAIVCDGTAQAVAALQGRVESGVFNGIRETGARPVAFMFPGQGSQYVNMARGLYATEAVFRACVDACAETLRALPETGLDADLRDVLYPQAEAAAAAATRKLTDTRYAQPALFVIDYAFARLWMHWGIRPTAMIGHSLGEYVAACLAGVMSLDDALRLVELRARLMSGLPGGTMLAVPLAASELHAHLDERVSIAGINGPALTVISGPEPAVATVQERLAAQGVEARRLHTSHAFHSAMMEPILETFTAQVAAIPLHAPQLPYLSNVSGDWITAEQATDPHYYARHLRQTVQFAPGLERLFAQPDWILLEAGPGQTLSTLAKRHGGRPAQCVVLCSGRHPEQVAADERFAQETLAQLWLAGVEPDWTALQGAPRRRVPLPTYPFERQRFWIDVEPTAAAHVTPPRASDPAAWVYVPSWRRVAAAPADAGKRAATWLCCSDARLGPHVEDALRAGGARVISVTAGTAFARLAPDRYQIDPAQAEDYAQLLGELLAAGTSPRYVAHLWGLTPTPHADAQLTLGFHSLVQLAQALERHAVTTPLGIAVISDQIHDVDGCERGIPERAMVLGPCKVLGMEYPHLHVRNIDLVVNDAAAEWQRQAFAVSADLCGDWSEPVMAHRGRYRWAQAFEPYTLAPADSLPAGLRRGGVYLITGGLGGVGLELAAYLARVAAAKLVLVGRSALPAREHWDAWLREHDDSDITSRRLRGVRAIEALGGDVLLRQADVADAAQLAAVVAAAEAHFGAVHGVIHAAGADKTVTAIGALDRATCAAQFRPRMQGLYALEQVLDGRCLDFCVVTSSLASVMGALGGTAYTAAHVFMDAFVGRHNRRALAPWIVINWDNWNTAGDAGVQTQFQMRPDQASEIFGRLLAAPRAAQYLISTGDLQARIDHWVRRDDTREETAAEIAPAAAASAHPRPALSVEYMEPRSAAETQLAEIWRAVLGIDRVGIHDNFFELGGDSVLNIQITARANQAGLKLTPKQVFEHQTIAELAAVAGAVTAAPVEQGGVTGSVPLTPIQHWFFEHHGARPQHFNLPLLLEAREPLERALLEQSLQRLVAHHDGLRLRYTHTADGWRQEIVPAVRPVPLHWVDLGAHTHAEQGRRIEEQGASLQASLDLTRGPLLQAAYFDLGAHQTSRLLLVVHHLLVDIISWRILLEDLQTLYRDLAAGREPQLPAKTVSLKHWAEAQATYAHSERAAAELAFWRAIGAQDIGTLPVDSQVGGNTAGSTATLAATLDADHTRALIGDLPRLTDASVHDALLLALAQAVTRVAGQRALYVTLEGHGRDALWDDTDPSRTVGWFTSLYPALLRIPDGADTAAQLAAIRDQYRAIPTHGQGYGVLRYLAPQADVRALLAGLAQPQIAFLYAGQIDQAFPADALLAPTGGAIGPYYDPAGERAHLLEVNSHVAQGQFRITWTYSKHRHRADNVQALADAFMHALRSLIDTLRQPPRDAWAASSGAALGAQTNAPVSAPIRVAAAPEPADAVQAAFTAADISADDLAEILRQQGS